MASWALSLFLVLGPVYRLPGVGMDVLRPIEWSILVVALGLVLGTRLLSGRTPFPTGVLGPLGFAGLLLLWIPGLVQAPGLFGVIEFVVQIALSAAFFWCFFCLAQDDWDNVIAIFRRALVIIVPLTAAALAAALAGTVDWRSPCGWNSTYVNGFGIRSTVWSAGMAMFLPVAALLLPPMRRHRPLVWNAFAAVGVVILLASQLVAGGRAGIVTSLLCLAALALLRRSRWLVGTVAVVGILASAPYWDGSCARHLQLPLVAPAVAALAGPAEPDSEMRSDSGIRSKEVAELSSHRIQGYLLAIEKTAERPFLGHGLFQVLVTSRWGAQSEIHNLWLKWSTYTGVAAPLLLLVMVALILCAGWRMLRDPLRPAMERDAAAVLSLVIFAGLVISMLEVNMPIGAFQPSSLWWAAAGALVGAAGRAAAPRDERGAPTGIPPTATFAERTGTEGEPRHPPPLGPNPPIGRGKCRGGMG